MSKFVYYKYVLTIVPFVLLINNLGVAWSLSDKKLCADPKCQKIISFGTTQITYNAGQEGTISFKINSPVRILSKSAGSDPTLWGIDVNGRQGFAPMQFIRETKVLISDKDLIYEIPIGSNENSLENSVIKPSENVVSSKTEELKPNSPESVSEPAIPIDKVNFENVAERNEPNVLLDDKMSDNVNEPKEKNIYPNTIQNESNTEKESIGSQNNIGQKDIYASKNIIEYNKDYEYDLDYAEDEDDLEIDTEEIDSLLTDNKIHNTNVADRDKKEQNLNDPSNLNKQPNIDPNLGQINNLNFPETIYQSDKQEMLNQEESIKIENLPMTDNQKLETSSESYLSESITNHQPEDRDLNNLKRNDQTTNVNSIDGSSNTNDTLIKIVPVSNINNKIDTKDDHLLEIVENNDPSLKQAEEKKSTETEIVDNEYKNQKTHEYSENKSLNIDKITTKDTSSSVTSNPSDSSSQTSTSVPLNPSAPSNLNTQSSSKEVPDAQLESKLFNTPSLPQFNDESSVYSKSSTPSDINSKITTTPTTNTHHSSLPSTKLNNHVKATNQDIKDNSNLKEFNTKDQNYEITTNVPIFEADVETQTDEVKLSTLYPHYPTKGFASPIQSTLDVVTTPAAQEMHFNNVENGISNEFSTQQTSETFTEALKAVEPHHVNSHTTEAMLSTQNPQYATEDLKRSTYEQTTENDSILSKEYASPKLQENLKLIVNSLENELNEDGKYNNNEKTLNSVKSTLDGITESPVFEIRNQNFDTSTNVPTFEVDSVTTHTTEAVMLSSQNPQYAVEDLKKTTVEENKVNDRSLNKDFLSPKLQENSKGTDNSLGNELNGDRKYKKDEKTVNPSKSTLDAVTDSLVVEMPYNNIEIPISNQNSETSTNGPTFEVDSVTTHTTEAVMLSTQNPQYAVQDLKKTTVEENKVNDRSLNKEFLRPKLQENSKGTDNSLGNELNGDRKYKKDEKTVNPSKSTLDGVTESQVVEMPYNIEIPISNQNSETSTNGPTVELYNEPNSLSNELNKFEMPTHDDAFINSKDNNINLEDNSLPKAAEKSLFMDESLKERGLFSTIVGTVKSFIQSDKKHIDSYQNNELNRILFNDDSKKHSENQYCLRSSVKTQFSMDNVIEVVVSKVLELSDLVVCLAVTGVTLLCFVFGYYCFCNSSREGSLLAKLNLLERSMLASQKENSILKSDLISTRKKLSSIEDNSFGSNDMVMSLKSELEEGKIEKTKLQEQIVNLEKELENAAEAGLELNKIVSELLSNQSGEDSIISSVEELQKQLNEQQNTIMEINANLAEKSRENSELQLLIAEQKAQFGSRITALEQDNDELEQEKSTLKARLEEIKSEFEEDITKALESKNSEIKRLQIEIYDSKLKFEEEHNKLQTSNAKVEALEECLKTMKKGNSNNVEQLIDVAYVRAELLDMQKKYSSLKENFDIGSEAKSIAENQLLVLSTEFEKMKEQFHQSEKDKLEAQTRLEVLASYFKEKEAQLQKELSLKETMWFKQQGEATSTVDRLTAMQEEIQSLRSQNDSLRAEIEAQIAAHKAQIGTLENRAHETWLAARQADRRYEESRAEAASLRRKLSTIAAFPNENTAVETKRNCELKTIPSPVPLEPPGSPLLGRLPPPPPFLPPHFMAPPPAFIGMPPPFMPPGEMRPAPLGRIMSPPPQHHSNRSGRYSADHEGFDPYDDDIDDIENIRRHRRHNDSWNQSTYSPPRTYRSHSPLDSRYDFDDDREFLSNTYDTETDLSPPPSPKRSGSWRSENFEDLSPQSKIIPSDKHDKRKHYSSTKKH